MTTSTAAITGNFIQRISTKKGPTEFSFLRKTTLLSDKYFILAMDNNLKAYWFTMEQRGGNWTIIDTIKVPNWIYEIQGKLAEAIELNNLS